MSGKLLTCCCIHGLLTLPTCCQMLPPQMLDTARVLLGCWSCCSHSPSIVHVRSQLQSLHHALDHLDAPLLLPPGLCPAVCSSLAADISLFSLLTGAGTSCSPPYRTHDSCMFDSQKTTTTAICCGPSHRDCLLGQALCIGTWHEQRSVEQQVPAFVQDRRCAVRLQSR
jgi:hypothetical protein